MLIDAKLWNAKIAQIEDTDSASFATYLLENPYIVQPFSDDFSAYCNSMKVAKDKLGKFGEFGKFNLTRIDRETNLSSSQIEARSNFIRFVSQFSILELDDDFLRRFCFIESNLTYRMGQMIIERTNGEIRAKYPSLSELDEKNRNFILRPNSSEPNQQIIHGYKNALKALIIHPFNDGNGRLSRMIATAAIINALKLEFVPYLEPFLRIRNQHISDGISHYLRTGEILPFMLAFSGGVRDGLGLSEG